jgi:hypothetical protein
MSVTIFKDVEEALAREVRRITTHDSRTLDKTILKETYDPISGELVTIPIEPQFYDSSADAGIVEYPHFFIRLMKTKEDRTTGRVVPQYGKWMICPVIYSPKAFNIIYSSEALISSLGNNLSTGGFQIRKVQPGHLIRLLEGSNVGTYKVTSVTVGILGNHTITVSNTLVTNLPSFAFSATTREIAFSTEVDINTIKVGDQFTDSVSNTYNVVAVNAAQGKFTIDGVSTPNISAGGIFARVGNVFQNTDLSPVRYIVMDPSQPISTSSGASASTSYVGVSPPVPIDAYYLIRIDSKTRQNHIDTLNRVWEEFNPPRTALPVIVRSALSADQMLTADVTTGGSNTIQVADNSNYNVGEKVYIFDDLFPSKRPDGEGFQRPFESIVINKISTNQIVLQNVVPDTFIISNCARIVSNAELRLFMFHFVDHVTKDVEGAQYWVHEFTFWVQVWVDRLEEGRDLTAVTDIASDIEDIDTSLILSDE